MVLRLPDPMLARADAIPRGPGWTFEPKLDGFRCMVCTHALFRARSRRGWDMTRLLPEFRRTLPIGVQLDGELVALDDSGRPDFHRLSARMLHGRTGIALTLFVFDVLAVEELQTTSQPYAERRALLEELVEESQCVRLAAKSYALDWMGKRLTQKGLPISRGKTGIAGLVVARAYRLPDGQARVGAKLVH
jgi:ATP-dependent DNA ligase